MGLIFAVKYIEVDPEIVGVRMLVSCIYGINLRIVYLMNMQVLVVKF
ncbi:MAG: hypothetical protein J7K82_04015 [Thermoproteales archaeon]|nr:hypothetical protein [Thermoproteales archaeon]